MAAQVTAAMPTSISLSALPDRKAKQKAAEVFEVLDLADLRRNTSKDDLSYLDIDVTRRRGMSVGDLGAEDAYALKLKADEFRAGYHNWRKQGFKGAQGQILDINVIPGEGEDIIAAVEDPEPIAAEEEIIYSPAMTGETPISDETMDMIMEQLLPPPAPLVPSYSAENAKESAVMGENWTQFFLHPDSAFHTSISGPRETLTLAAENLPLIAQQFNQARHTHLSMTEPREELEHPDMPPALASAFNPTAEIKTQVPAYPRNVYAFENIICHIGVGGFHRSHEAMYINKLLQMEDIDEDGEAAGNRWGIVGIGLMPWDNKMREALVSQDCCYTLVTRSPEGCTAEVVGSIVDFVYAPDDRRAAVERLANPATKIVSLTVTEKGYCLDVDNKLDPSNDLVAHDLKHPNQPQSAVGLIVAALKLRRARGLKAFTVLSCDNLPGNGTLSRLMTIAYLDALGNPGLKKWVIDNAKFVNTMVDRITPVTQPEHIDLVKSDYGIDDKWPVIAEDYVQWVVEDQFVDGVRPDLEKVGVLLVPDVHPYELMKLRLLNAGHSALSYMSYLCGHRFVDAAMNDDKIVNFLKLVFAEHTSTLAPVPGVDVADYIEILIKRFSNPYIKDTVQRLAEDGSMKLVTTMRDAAVENLAAGRSVPMFCLTVASWIRYMVGTDEYGEEIEIKDPQVDTLNPMAREILGADDQDNGDLIVAPPQDMKLLKEYLTLVFGDDIGSSKEVITQVYDMLTDICNTSVAQQMALQVSG